MNRQNGASLIEVMVAIVLLGFGLLSLIGLQGFAVTTNKNAANRGIATMLAANIADILRANPTAASGYDRVAAFDATDVAPPTWIPLSAPPCEYPGCSAAQIAEIDRRALARQIKSSLQAGTYSLATDTAGRFADLWIMWAEVGGPGESAFDNCPATVTAGTPSSIPRCLYMRVGL